MYVSLEEIYRQRDAAIAQAVALHVKIQLMPEGAAREAERKRLIRQCEYLTMIAPPVRPTGFRLWRSVAVVETCGGHADKYKDRQFRKWIADLNLTPTGGIQTWQTKPRPSHPRLASNTRQPQRV